MPCFILFSRFIIDLSLKIKVLSSANKIGLKQEIYLVDHFYIIQRKLNPIQILMELHIEYYLDYSLYT